MGANRWARTGMSLSGGIGGLTPIQTSLVCSRDSADHVWDRPCAPGARFTRTLGGPRAQLSRSYRSAPDGVRRLRQMPRPGRERCLQHAGVRAAVRVCNVDRLSSRIRPGGRGTISAFRLSNRSVTQPRRAAATLRCPAALRWLSAPPSLNSPSLLRSFSPAPARPTSSPCQACFQTEIAFLGAITESLPPRDGQAIQVF